MEEELLLLQGSSVAVPPLESNKYSWPSESDFGTTEELMMMGDLVDEAAAVSSSSPVRQQQQLEQEEPRRRRESMLNKLISTVYSGPTISDIESALSFTGGDQLAAAVDARNYNSAGPVVFSPEKVLSKMENKYTLKIKTSTGNGGLAEDGYKWRKYGQKSIKNSPNPRSYYRCTNPRCNAKKQVERSTEEPDTLVVTYEGLHLHYTYSHFLQAQPQQPPPQPKKPKIGGPQPIIMLEDLDGPAQQDIITTGGPLEAPAPPPAFPLCYPLLSDDDVFQFQQPAAAEQQPPPPHITNGNGGLLEDMVPLLVRRPCSSSSTTTGSSSTGTGTSSPSPDLLSTSSSVSWNPTSPYIDMAILSNIF